MYKQSKKKNQKKKTQAKIFLQHRTWIIAEIEK